MSSDSSFVKQRIELGLANEETYQNIVSDIKMWMHHPDSFFAFAWCEAIGWKE